MALAHPSKLEQLPIELGDLIFTFIDDYATFFRTSLASQWMRERSRNGIFRYLHLQGHPLPLIRRVLEEVYKGHVNAVHELFLDTALSMVVNSPNVAIQVARLVCHILLNAKNIQKLSIHVALSPSFLLSCSPCPSRPQLRVFNFTGPFDDALLSFLVANPSIDNLSLSSSISTWTRTFAPSPIPNFLPNATKVFAPPFIFEMIGTRPYTEVGIDITGGADIVGALDLVTGIANREIIIQVSRLDQASSCLNALAGRLGFLESVVIIAKKDVQTGSIQQIWDTLDPMFRLPLLKELNLIPIAVSHALGHTVVSLNQITWFGLKYPRLEMVRVGKPDAKMIYWRNENDRSWCWGHGY